MPILRPNQLPAATTPLGPTDLVVVDQGAGGVNAADPQDVVDAAAPVPSQAEAEAGSDNTKRMTALRTKQSIASQVGVTLASKAQGDLASSAVQPSRQVIAGAGLTGGGALSGDVTVNVGAGTGIAVAADTVGLDATTQSRLLIGGGTTSQVLQKVSGTDYDVAWATVAAVTAVSYAPQTLSGPEQLQARTNISAADSATAVTLAGSQTLTNKTLTSPIVNSPQLTLVQSTSPTPTAEGRIEWDTDDDKLVVGTGSGQAVFGQITPWVAYTPSLTGFGTPTGVAFRSRRVGGSLEVFGRFTSGTATVVEARISIGFNGADGSVAVNSFMNSAIWPVGYATKSTAAAATFVLLATGGQTYLRIGLQNSGRDGLTPVTGDVANSTGVFAFFASIPIEGWS